MFFKLGTLDYESEPIPASLQRLSAAFELGSLFGKEKAESGEVAAMMGDTQLGKDPPQTSFRGGGRFQGDLGRQHIPLESQKAPQQVGKQ